MSGCSWRLKLGGRGLRVVLACCKVAVDVCFLSSRIYCAGSGTGPLTRPSSSTDGLSVPDRWRLTWRPRSAEGRLFVDHYLGGLLGSAVEAARRAEYPWTEQMSRKLSRKVRETRSSSSRKRSEPVAHPCRGPGGQAGDEHGGPPWFKGMRGRGHPLCDTNVSLYKIHFH